MGRTTEIMNSAYLVLLPIDADISLFSYDLEADSRIVLLRIVTTRHTPTRALLGAVVDRRRSILRTYPDRFHCCHLRHRHQMAAAISGHRQRHSSNNRHHRINNNHSSPHTHSCLARRGRRSSSIYRSLADDIIVLYYSYID